MIAVGPDVNNIPLKIFHAGLLAFHTVARPTSRDENIPRPDPLSLSKLEAEGQPAESMSVLGILVDTRKMLLQLEEAKFFAYTKDIDTLLTRR